MKKIFSLTILLFVFLIPCFATDTDWTDFSFSGSQFCALSSSGVWYVSSAPRNYEYKVDGDTVYINITMIPGGVVYNDSTALGINPPDIVASEVDKTPDYMIIVPCTLYVYDGTVQRVPGQALYDAENNSLIIVPMTGYFEDDVIPAGTTVGVNIQFSYRQVE